MASECSENTITASEKALLQKTGNGVFGPLLVGFIDWLSEANETKDIDQFVFLARDGYIPLEAAKILDTSIANKSIYLHASRLSTFPTRVLDNPSVERFLEESRLRRLTSPALLIERTGLKRSEISDLQGSSAVDFNKAVDKKYYFEKGTPYYKFAQNVYEIWLPIAKKNSEIFEEYIDALVSQNRIGVIDVGWVGSTQAALDILESKKAKKRVYQGFYIGVSAQTKVNAKGYLYDGSCNGPLDRWKYNACLGLIELFLGTSSGSCACYKVDSEGEIFPVFQPYEYFDESAHEYLREHYMLQILRASALEYAKSTAKVEGRKRLSVQEASAPIQRLAIYPTQEEKQLFGSMRFSEGRLHSLANPAALSFYLTSPRKLIADFAASTWKIGFLSQLLNSNRCAKAIYQRLKLNC